MKRYDRVQMTVIMDHHGSLEGRLEGAVEGRLEGAVEGRLEGAVDDLEKELGHAVAR